MDPENSAEPLKCICGRTLRESEAIQSSLTPDEQQAFAQKGLTAPQSLCYCRPCSRILKHPEYGPRYLQGRFVTLAISNGVSTQQATILGDRYYQKLRGN